MHGVEAACGAHSAPPAPLRALGGGDDVGRTVGRDPDAASPPLTRSTRPSRSFGYAARCTPGCGDQLGGPAFARVP